MLLEIMFSHCAGIDVHKKSVTVCVIIPGLKDKKGCMTKTFGTTTKELQELREWLLSLRVTHVAMESTGVYWKPVYNILTEGLEVWVVNAQHIKQVPGRKTDVKDAEWIASLMRMGLLRNSFIPPQEQRDLRDLTRYRTRLIQERSSAANRLQKVLEDANIKLSSVVSDIQGVSARLMLEGLIGEENSAEELAQLAKGRLRSKIELLIDALTGHVRDHHRFLLRELLTHLDHLKGQIEAISDQISLLLTPHEDVIERLDGIVGVGQTTAEIVVAEIGINVDHFPSSKHLASWACLCPGNNTSGGKRLSGKTRKGQKWLRAALTEAAWAASRSKDTYLSAQFHRIRARRGAKRAAIAVAHSILNVVYYLLKNPNTTFVELGGDYFIKRSKGTQERRARKTLEALGYKVTLVPAAS